MAEERPDLEEAKNQLIVSNAKMKSELKEIEDKILQRLSSSQGSPVDDVDLIKTLEASKIKSQEIKVSKQPHTAVTACTLSDTGIAVFLQANVVTVCQKCRCVCRLMLSICAKSRLEFVAKGQVCDSCEITFCNRVLCL